MRDSGLFAVVANTWFCGLQSSTFRRGMIPVSLTGRADGTVRYSAEATAMLRAMKDATIADARAVLATATAKEGFSVGDQPPWTSQLVDELTPAHILLLRFLEHPGGALESSGGSWAEPGPHSAHVNLAAMLEVVPLREWRS
jgi:hypothetical protein